MRNFTLLCCAMLMAALGHAQEFEKASDAVVNMRIGWNTGNRLDVNSGDDNNMWIEAWTEGKPVDYETAWGQPQITKELIHMFKEAGFNAIRVPVTWYPHFGNVVLKDLASTNWVPIWDIDKWTGYDIDPVWMARVREVVDYVIDEGMYCILNVHHDTGAATTAWLRADENVYEQQKERFENLWTAIATEFKDYDQKLLFEGYNEMLDNYGSWCFASFFSPSKYDAAVSASAYNAINKYAQSFVNAVRATGGNNAQRNLIVNTYGACCGEGGWNEHLTDPLTEMKVPEDDAEGHIIFEIHSYPTPTSNESAKVVVDNLLSVLNKHLKPKGCPIILGEWGIGEEKGAPYFNDMAKYMVQRCKEENIATFLWMVLADGDDCKEPKWSNPDLKDAIVKGYYGEGGYNSISQIGVDPDATDAPYYNLQGIKVNNPSRPGIYIHNGNKYLLK